ncbi:hypothetical protein NJB1604_35850 [Mycobacterium marinum]|uniref:hypothetical protein n=1 Tax=Mycobacterium marinum TaxID=1781 RepID=UPI0021C3BF2F|nr:hypothetical protein [Mycobacterium marinum]GJO50200.1 hypothetical protein NJB1604_35850 [Mycobacterium marinum]
MHDLDDDDRDPYPPPWHAGRPKPISRGPVIEAYVDTEALEHACTNCNAKPGDFCRHDTEHGGGQRKVPCPKRIITAAQAGAPNQKPKGDQ